MYRRILIASTLAIVGVLAVVGCSSQRVVKRGELESGVKSKLEAVAHAKAKSVTCPDTLKAKVNATTRCTLKAMDGSKIGVTVTVTSINGGRVTYTAKADPTPMR